MRECFLCNSSYLKLLIRFYYVVSILFLMNNNDKCKIYNCSKIVLGMSTLVFPNLLWQMVSNPHNHLKNWISNTLIFYSFTLFSSKISNFIQTTTGQFHEEVAWFSKYTIQTLYKKWFISKNGLWKQYRFHLELRNLEAKEKK